MTTNDMKEKIHQGRNVKRFREMLGIKQDALAIDLGDDWNQQKVSLLEQKETIDDDLLQQISQALKVPVEAIKNFDEQAAITYFNSFFEGSINHGHFSPSFNNCTFNPMDKIVELYEALVKSEKEKVELLQKMLDEKK